MDFAEDQTRGPQISLRCLGWEAWSERPTSREVALSEGEGPQTKAIRSSES